MDGLAVAVGGASALLIGLTLLPLLRSTRWWVRLWDYPRAQLAAGLAAMILLQGALAPEHPVEWVLLGASLVALLWQAWLIAPYTRIHRVQSPPATRTDPDNTISLLIANVLQDNRDAATLLRHVDAKEPDILVLVETDEWWDRHLEPLLARYPHAVRHPLDNTYGMHLFSRLDLSETRVFDRVTPGIPSIFTRVRLRSGRLIDFYAVHPEPPQPGNDVEERDAELLLVAREVHRLGRPAIVAGDLNDVAWSHSTRLFQRLSGLLDPRVGRGIFPTFHARWPIARWPLDHVFHHPTLALERIEVLGYFGSDHFPVHARFVFDPDAADERTVPEPDASDVEEAQDKITEGRQATAES